MTGSAPGPAPDDGTTALASDDGVTSLAPVDGVTALAPVGGRSWYVCGAFAVGKWFFITNPPLFAAMAIAGGLACGFGL